MRVLVIGGTRFIGPHVVRGLHAAGHDVTVLHRGRTPTALPSGVHEVLGDRAALAEPGSPLREAVRDLAPEVVVDLIAMTEGDARATVDTFRGVARRLVVASSMDVYRAYSLLHRKEEGDPLPVPFAEGGPLRVLRYPYRDEQVGGGASEVDTDHYEKLDVEQAVREAGDIESVVLRLPAVYGPNDANHRLRPYVAAMDEGRDVIRLAESYAGWRWTQDYVENVAHAVVLGALHERATGIYNAGPAETPSMAGFVEAIGSALGWRGRVEVAPDLEQAPPGEGALDFSHHLVGDTSGIRRELGYEAPVSLAEGIRRTAEYERAPVSEDAE